MEKDKIIEFFTEIIGGYIYSPYDPSARGIHFLIGALIQYVSIRLNKPILGLVLVLILAFVKELFDLYKDDHFDEIDLIVTILGAVMIYTITKT